MIKLRKMTPEEFAAFREQSVAFYADDLVTAKGISREDALREAGNEFDAELPDGPETKFNHTMMIADPERNADVGWIWFSFSKEEISRTKEVFLEDLLIYGPERRKGFASGAISEMLRIAKESGCEFGSLFVWNHNPEGEKLYEKCGFATVRAAEGGKYMRKAL